MTYRILGMISILFLTFAFHGAAHAQSDVIGVYWDAAATTTEIEIDAWPTVRPAYLVLGNPSRSGGIIGWECRITTEGSGMVASVELSGTSLNVAQQPDFVVGLASPLPPNAAILLATLQVMAVDSEPCAVRLDPVSNPSLDGAMSYIPADDPGDIVATRPNGGDSRVAWINRYYPALAYDPAVVTFPLTTVGFESGSSVDILNGGTTDITLDLSCFDDCPDFAVRGTPPSVVPAGGRITLELVFAPQAPGERSCTVVPAPRENMLTMIGSGKPPTVEGTAPPTVEFVAALGDTAWRTVTVVNTGEAAFLIKPVIGTGRFFLTDTAPFTLHLGGRHDLTIYYPVTTAGEFVGELQLGDYVDPVELVGRALQETPPMTVMPAAMDFGPTHLDEPRTARVLVTNEGTVPTTLNVGLDRADAGFAITAGGGAVVLPAGWTHGVDLVFAPMGLFDHAAELFVHPELPAVPLAGEGIPSAIRLTVEPDSLVFGPRPPFYISLETVTVNNVGSVPATLDVVLPDPENLFAIEQGGGTVDLAAGAAHAVVVRFMGIAEGRREAQLEIHPQVSPVPLIGLTLEEQIAFAISPARLDFPPTPVGASTRDSCTVTNTGDVVIQLAPTLMNNTAGFALVAGGAPGYLGAGESRTVVLEFAPTAADTHGTALSLGPELDLVPLAGEGMIPYHACMVEPASVDFGIVNRGETSARTVLVTNDGNLPLTLAPGSTSTDFLVDEEARVLPAGETTAITIHFTPRYEGPVSATVSLGAAVCSTVSCSGIGQIPPVSEPTARVGIYFDTMGLNYTLFTTTATPVIPIYLLLVDAGGGSGVAGWEAAFDFEGPVFDLGWHLAGSSINIVAPPQFVVGVAEPLPPSAAILLATANLLLYEPQEVELHLHPVDSPSIPDRLAWVDAAGVLRPLPTRSGHSLVATINFDSGPPVAVESPPPVAHLVDGAVELRWSSATLHGDCHLYRRAGHAPEIRLTDEPLRAEGEEFRYRDTLDSVGGGVSVRYRYALVVGGVETERGSSVTLEIPAHAVPGNDRLLPNIPNPFNPATSIRFEIGRSGPARLTVHDLSGRCVRDLLDTYVSPGWHEETWDGRDNEGRRVPSGAYHVRLTTGSRTDTRKVLLVK